MQMIHRYDLPVCCMHIAAVPGRLVTSTHLPRRSGTLSLLEQELQDLRWLIHRLRWGKVCAGDGIVLPALDCCMSGDSLQVDYAVY